MKSPFKFLDSFTLEDKDSFFGREKEVEQLYAMVNQNRLILVYGPSGTGKTSLVQCGLASQFETVDWYPIFIRKGEDINRSLGEALKKALKDELFDTYVETIEELYAQYVRPIYLLFDQFEELFILGRPEEQAVFFENIAALSAARLPCRIIFILREEYLAHLYEFEQVVPSLLDRRLRVEPMSYKNVGEVVRRSCKQFNISLEDPENNIEQIIQNLRSGSSTIHLPYLQVYLDMLYREDMTRTYPHGAPEGGLPPLSFTTEEINQFGRIDNVLEKFLEEQSQALQARMQKRHPGFPENGVLQALDLFVTEEGTKRPIDYTREEEQVCLPDKFTELLPEAVKPALSDTLQELESRRLLRFSEDTIELPHDSLAILIDQKRTDEQRQLNAVLRQLKTAYGAYGNTQEYLTRKQLNAYEDFLPKLSLDEDILSFIADSRTYIEALERKEQERQERELLTHQKLEAEQQAARRQRIFIGLIGIALLAMIGLASWAYGQQKKAELYAAFAEKKSGEAIRSAKDAEDQRQEALGQKKLAEANAAFAQEKSKEAEESAQIAQSAFRKLKASNAEIVRLILQNAEKDISRLDYSAALEKVKTAASVGELKEKVAKSHLELAFWFGESGETQQAANLLNSAAQLVNNSAVLESLQALPRDAAAARKKIRDVIQLFDKSTFDVLWARYYPVMVEVEGGTFLMGSEEGDDEKSHLASVSSFYIAKYETTWWQYALFCKATGRLYVSPSWGTDGNNPAVFVKWIDAVEYTNWVSRQLGYEEAVKGDDWNYTINLKSNGFRLPTEAEWEYAARGGYHKSSYIYAGSDEVDEIAWYERNSGMRAHRVGEKEPNVLGIYDMSGNVWEWCWDRYDSYLDNPPLDYTGPLVGFLRVLRGGAYFDKPVSARCVYRDRFPLVYLNSFTGFRLARTGGQ